MRKYLCDDFTCCVDVKVLLGALGCDYDADEWRLFTDSTKASLKCLLLHTGN